MSDSLCFSTALIFYDPPFLATLLDLCRGQMLIQCLGQKLSDTNVYLVKINVEKYLRSVLKAKGSYQDCCLTLTRQFS